MSEDFSHLIFMNENVAINYLMMYLKRLKESEGPRDDQAMKTKNH